MDIKNFYTFCLVQEEGKAIYLSLPFVLITKMGMGREKNQNSIQNVLALEWIISTSHSIIKLFVFSPSVRPNAISVDNLSGAGTFCCFFIVVHTLFVADFN